MIRTTWRREVAGIYKGIDAQTVADEINEIGEEVTPEKVLEAARDGGTELHKCFTWDDTIAAEKYRLIEARNILRFLVREQPVDDERPPIRTFYKAAPGEGYKSTERVFMKNVDEYQALLARAMMELKAFKAKYSMLEELQEIFDMIS